MARDLRQVGYNRNRYPDKCYLFDSTAVNNNKLVVNAQPLTRFYKRDIVPFQWGRAVIDGVVTNRKQLVGTIETSDHLEMARPDMYVLDQTGTLYIIEGPIVSDDADKSKVVGTRPTIITKMVLKGLG